MFSRRLAADADLIEIRRYEPPPPADPNSDDDQLEATNFENSALFLISCFQYILVAAVFSIGAPYRRSMWTNGDVFPAALALTRRVDADRST